MADVIDDHDKSVHDALTHLVDQATRVQHKREIGMYDQKRAEEVNAANVQETYDTITAIVERVAYEAAKEIYNANR